METKNYLLNKQLGANHIFDIKVFLKYLLIAIVATGIDFVISIVFYSSFRIQSVISSLIGNVCGLIFQYIFLMKFVYCKKVNIYSIFIYLLTYAIGITVSCFIVYIFHHVLATNFVFSKSMAIIIPFFLNYLLRNKLFMSQK